MKDSNQWNFWRDCKCFYFVALLLFSVNAWSEKEIPQSKKSCLSIAAQAGPYDKWGFPLGTHVFTDQVATSASEELDHIYSLMTYALVFKNWQGSQTKPKRGHNFGSILVDQHNKIVSWGVNHSHRLHDETQHAETRAIQQYLKRSSNENLEGFTMYVAGDSCMMCAGMMAQQKVQRVVLGITNPFFGKNFDRLNLNSSQCGNSQISGYLPAPRFVHPKMSSSRFRKKLDAMFKQEVIDSCQSKSLIDCHQPASQTQFLEKEAVKKVYKDATNQFFHFSLEFPNERATGSKLTNKELYHLALKITEKF